MRKRKPGWLPTPGESGRLKKKQRPLESYHPLARQTSSLSGELRSKRRTRSFPGSWSKQAVSWEKVSTEHKSYSVRPQEYVNNSANGRKYGAGHWIKGRSPIKTPPHRKGSTGSARLKRKHTRKPLLVDLEQVERKGKELKLRRASAYNIQNKFKIDAVVKDKDEQFYRVVKVEEKYTYCYMCAPSGLEDRTEKPKVAYFKPEDLYLPLERVKKKESRVMYSDSIVLTCNARNEVMEKREKGLRTALLEKMKRKSGPVGEIDAGMVTKTLFPSRKDYNFNVLNRLCKNRRKGKKPVAEALEPWELNGETKVVLDRSTLPDECPW